MRSWDEWVVAAVALAVCGLFVSADDVQGRGAAGSTVRVMVVVGSVLSTATAPLTHCWVGAKVHGYRLWQPLCGGHTFVLMQSAGWTLFAVVSLVEVTIALNPSVNYTLMWDGVLSVCGLLGLLSHALLLFSLGYFVDRAPALHQSERAPVLWRGDEGELLKMGSKLTVVTLSLSCFGFSVAADIIRGVRLRGLRYASIHLSDEWQVLLGGAPPPTQQELLPQSVLLSSTVTAAAAPATATASTSAGSGQEVAVPRDWLGQVSNPLLGGMMLTALSAATLGAAMTHTIIGPQLHPAAARPAAGQQTQAAALPPDDAGWRLFQPFAGGAVFVLHRSIWIVFYLYFNKRAFCMTEGTYWPE